MFTRYKFGELEMLEMPNYFEGCVTREEISRREVEVSAEIARKHKEDMDAIEKRHIERMTIIDTIGKRMVECNNSEDLQKEMDAMLNALKGKW